MLPPTFLPTALIGRPDNEVVQGGPFSKKAKLCFILSCIGLLRPCS